MTPAQQAKAEGLKSLSEVSEKSGVSLQTLTNWHRDKPKLFAVVLAGCKAPVDEDHPQFEGFVRAFWRRIDCYKNDHGKELPNPLPVEFRAHMATALSVFR